MKSQFGWTIAIASIAFWVLAPTSWTQAIRGNTPLSSFLGQKSVQAEDLGAGNDFWTSVFGGDGGITISSCEPSPTPSSAATPGSAENPAPAAAPSTNQSGLTATFRLCGSADPQTQRAIEQLIAGRGYSATLVSRADGCADLTIAVAPGASGSGGSQSTNLSVSTSSGRTISVQIYSANGATQVTIGAGSS